MRRRDQILYDRIVALEAECDALRVELEAMRECHDASIAVHHAAIAEVERLRACQDDAYERAARVVEEREGLLTPSFNAEAEEIAAAIRALKEKK